MIALATWSHGLEPARLSYSTVSEGGTALDAVERGGTYCEADLTCMSVGRGALPDANGFVTLDASIMDHLGNCGSVAFVQHYLEVTKLARRVMEKTDHVMLVGAGAEDFAAEQGFKKSDLLTASGKELYEKWRVHPDKLRVRLRRVQEGSHEYTLEEIEPSAREAGGSHELNSVKPTNESHDTIGLLALDTHGHLAGACTTSGLAFKKHGRVGDSPIIGAGLYVDGETGSAVATGNGELVMRACSSFHVVELMRQGIEPDNACEIAIERIKRDRHLTDEMQIGLIALRKDGSWASRALRPGFQFAVQDGTTSESVLYDCDRQGYRIFGNDS
jgi:N4-(beta-N-acetylglucosaminyl)-L-asparaginase